MQERRGIYRKMLELLGVSDSADIPNIVTLKSEIGLPPGYDGSVFDLFTILYDGLKDVVDVTLTSVIATDVLTVAGEDFTCVADSATGNEFNVGTDDIETAANLAAVIEAVLTDLNDVSVDGDVITISGEPFIPVSVTTSDTTFTIEHTVPLYEQLFA
jgi:hypothetical protein